MAVSSLFSKLKTLTPVGVVGLAVVVTIKLLTTTTPTNEEIIQVKAEEDIKTEDYKDEIKEPEAPPEEKVEEEQETEQAEDKGEEDPEQEEAEEEEGESDSESPQDQEEKEEEKKKDDKPEPPKQAGRTWINDPNNKVASLLKGILGGNKKQ